MESASGEVVGGGGSQSGVTQGRRRRRGAKKTLASPLGFGCEKERCGWPVGNRMRGVGFGIIYMVVGGKFLQL